MGNLPSDSLNGGNGSPASAKGSVRLVEVSKRYILPQGEIFALHPCSIDIIPGSFTALVGPSGSGKSTLLALCAGLDRPSGGEIFIDGVKLNDRSEGELALLRGERIGFVFQSFHLLRSLTALENVLIPAELAGKEGANRAAVELLDRVGLGERMHHYPHQLSGGEQQRVAIARAYINHPTLLLGDEPTGNLDEESASAVELLLDQLRREHGTTVLIATHNLDLAARAERVIRLKAGRIASDTLRPRTGAAGAEGAEPPL